MKNEMLAVGLALLLSGCGLFSKKQPPPPQRDLIAAAAFEDGVKLLDARKYREAAQFFESFLVKYPASDLDLVAEFNLGAAHEGIGNCERARDQYRQVARTLDRSRARLQAEALIRLSYMYECLNQDEKLLATLLDAHRRRNILPPEVGQAEVPARLASAYARLGDRELARKYFLQAEEGLKVAHRGEASVEKKKELLAQTLYQMGRLQPIERAEWGGETYLESLRYLQPYLLKSVEMNHNPWSVRAVDEILTSYEKFWLLIDPSKVRWDKKSHEEGVRVQKARNLAVQMALENLEALKGLRFPDPQEPNMVKGLFAALDQHERKLRNFLTENAPVTPLTSEAEKRQALKQEGRVENPNPVLEKNKRRSVQKLPAKKKADPNL